MEKRNRTGTIGSVQRLIRVKRETPEEDTIATDCCTLYIRPVDLGIERRSLRVSQTLPAWGNRIIRIYYSKVYCLSEPLPFSILSFYGAFLVREPLIYVRYRSSLVHIVIEIPASCKCRFDFYTNLNGWSLWEVYFLGFNFKILTTTIVNKLCAILLFKFYLSYLSKTK